MSTRACDTCTRKVEHSRGAYLPGWVPDAAAAHDLLGLADVVLTLSGAWLDCTGIYTATVTVAALWSEHTDTDTTVTLAMHAWCL